MALCVSLNSRTLQELRTGYAEAVARGADWVELRLDYLEPAERARLPELAEWVAAHGRRLIMTCRPRDQGGRYDGPEPERVSTLLEAAGMGAARVDVEAATFRDHPAVRARLESEPGPGDIRGLILSEHHLEGRPGALSRRFLDLCDSPAEIIKLTWRGRDARDNLEALDLLRTSPRPAAVFCLGHDGLASRVLGRKFGAALTYCALGPGAEVAPGQPTLGELSDLYRWPEISPGTAVYGVLGDPVQHSLGPVVHNAAFTACGIDAVYLPFRLPGDGHMFAEFIQQIMERPWLDVRGLSVTAPHKRHAWLLTEADLGPLPRRVGAVNTLIFSEGGIAGDNTDLPATLQWLARGLDCELPGLAERRFDVLGAGGYARSVVAALRMLGAGVTVHNRTLDRAAALASEFGCSAAQLGPDTRLEGDVLVNCTAAGLNAAPGDGPVRPEQIRAGGTVFDATYNPRPSRLLIQAGQRGCRTIDGLDLFLEQAALQFAAWTSQEPPRPIMRAAALARLDSPPAQDAPS